MSERFAKQEAEKAAGVVDDVTGEAHEGKEVEYECYLVPAQKYYRVNDSWKLGAVDVLGPAVARL